MMDGNLQLKLLSFKCNVDEGLLGRVCIDMYYTYKYILHYLFIFKRENYYYLLLLFIKFSKQMK